MTWYEGAFLGFLQGATEFLPVSSSGHLVMGQEFLDTRLPGVGFEVALHVATLASEDSLCTTIQTHNFLV